MDNKKKALAGALCSLSGILIFAHARAEGIADVMEQLETVEVKGQFLSPASKSAMKLDVPVRDTPFSVSSYSDSFMKAIETTNVADMYKYMTGVARPGGSGNDLNMRGFSMTAEDRNAILVNGLPGLAGRFGSPPTVMVDHMDVVKGPASVLYGQAQPGGFVNIVSKMPEATRSATFDGKGLAYWGAGVGLSDAKGYSGSADLTGPVDSGHKLLYRFIAERLDKDTFRTDAYERTIYLAPSLTWNIDRATNATVIFERRKGDTAYDLFLAAPLNDIGRAAPITTRYQQPGDFRNESSKALSLSANHTFDGGAKWNFAMRAVKHHDDAAGFDQTGFITSGFARDGTTCSAANPCLRMRARGQHNEREWDFYDTNLNLPFSTRTIGHKVLVGINGGREIANFRRLQFSNGVASCATPTSFNCLTQNLYNPVYDLPALGTLPIGNLNNPVTNSYSFGVYVSDVITLAEKWKATVGARYAKDRQVINDFVLKTPTQTKSTSKAIPMAGLLYQPNKEWTIYTSYATSYVAAPASDLDTNGQNPFKPELSSQVEAGVKVDLGGGKTTASLAVYQIDKKDALFQYSNAPLCPAAIGTCTQQVGKVQSKGLELEFNVRPAASWQVTAGYAYTDAKIKTSLPGSLFPGVPLEGSHLVNVPRNSAHVWSRYDFSESLNGWGLGLGANFVGRRPGTLPTFSDTSILKLSAYGIMDMGVYYTRGRYDFTFKVNNVFDKRYIESSGFEAGALQILPGAPRNLQATARANF